ncbi:MAG: ribonuclease HI family protein [Syntrophales bacterium]|nr:ribonuclease HI family protein [Syntrophales bacterium]
MVDSIFNLYTDGACRGNPGYGGAGVVLADEKGNIVGTMGKFLGLCTNNLAEYQALIIGLEEALRKRCRRLHIFLDSELLVNQINGVYRVKNDKLTILMGDIRRLLASFDGYVVEHIGREKNKTADKLANQAIDEALKTS